MARNTGRGARPGRLRTTDSTWLHQNQSPGVFAEAKQQGGRFPKERSPLARWLRRVLGLRP